MPPTPSSRTALVRRARKVNRELAALYPDAHTELDFTTPLELLVATILSAQTTDKRVNMVTPILFAKYRSAADYAAADRDELEKIIHCIDRENIASQAVARRLGADKQDEIDLFGHVADVWVTKREAWKAGSRN